MKLTRRSFLAGTVGAAVFALTGAVKAGAEVAPEVQAWLDAPMQVGDIFTVDGVFAMSPITFKNTDYLQQFVVTDVLEDGTIKMHPRATFDPGRIRPLVAHG